MKTAVLIISLIVSFALNAQSLSDTLNRYEDGRFLLRQNGRYELKQGDSLISYWDKMDEVLSLDYKTYQVIKRKTGEQWGKGLFRRNEGKLFLNPEHEIVNSFFGDSKLVYVKGKAGCSVFSVITGKKTRDGYSHFRRFANNDCLGFNEWGMFIYNKELELTDSIADLQFESRQVDYGDKAFLFLKYRDGHALLDDQYRISQQPGWTGIVKLTGNFLLIETPAGQGVYHTELKLLITETNHTPFLYEMHENRFMLNRMGEYILYDSTGKILTQVKADGLSCVDDLQAFFYHQNDKWGIMNAVGKILQVPAFVDFNTSSPPIGYFIARKKGETGQNRYAWVYSLKKGRRTITGVKLLGPYKETDTYQSSWPPNQPVEIKQN